MLSNIWWKLWGCVRPNHINNLADWQQMIIASPRPVQHHWFIRQQKVYRMADRRKSQMISEAMIDAKSRLLKVGVTDDAITSAVDALVRKESQMAEKEGRPHVYVFDNC